MIKRSSLIKCFFVSLILKTMLSISPCFGVGPVFADKPLPTNCICEDGQPLMYNPEDADAPYVLLHTTWLMSDKEWCYKACLQECGCDISSSDLSCSRDCILGDRPQNDTYIPPISPPTTAVDPDPNIPWVVIIGGVILAGAAVAAVVGVGVIGSGTAIVASRSKNRKQKHGHNDEDKIIKYVLQLSTNEVTLKENQPKTISINCWQVRASGTYEQARHAIIQVAPPPPSSNITVTPTNGVGSMELVVNLIGKTDYQQYPIKITALSGGQGTSTTLILKLLPAIRLKFTETKARPYLEPGGDGLWASAYLTTDWPTGTFNPDKEIPKITFSVTGPNAKRVEINNIVYQQQKQWVQLFAKAPNPQDQLERGNPVLLAEYRWDEVILTDRLTLELQPEYQLVVKPFQEKQPDITYELGDKKWKAPALHVYWINPNKGDIPVDPGFKYKFSDPSAVIDPQVLTIESFEPLAPHQYLLKFQVEQDLENTFGEDLTDDHGIVKINIEALDQNQESYKAEIDYTVRPEAIPILYFWKDSPETRYSEEREYKNLKLKVNEVLADTYDEVCFGAFLVRSDQADPFEKAYDHSLNLQALPDAELITVYSSFFHILPEEGYVDFSRYVGRLKAHEIYFYDGPEWEIIIQTQLVLDNSKYPNYIYPEETLHKIMINPIMIYLKLWVFPGIQTGTSLAGALMFVPSKGVGLRDFELTMDIQSKGSRLTADQAVQQTNAEGLARWTLSYQGMNWSNYRSSYFTVRCGVPKPKGGFKGTQVQIDIGKNVDTFVADVYQQRNSAALNLENPDFKTGSGFMATVADFAWPDFLCGPVNNMIAAVTDNYQTYVCKNLSLRIIEWCFRRRTGEKISNFDEKRIMSMNGIDIAQYNMYILGPMYHIFTGIFLANADKTPTDDPRFIDPWWIQNWSHPVRRTVNGLYTKMNQYTILAGYLASVALVCIFAWKFVMWKWGAALAGKITNDIKYIFFGSGYGGAVPHAAMGISIWWPEGLVGNNYKHPYNFDSIPNAISSLKQKEIPAVKPIVEW